MRIVVTGGTGFIGVPLCRALVADGYQVTVLTRSASHGGTAPCRAVSWQPPALGSWASELNGADGVVNLAGQPVIGRRWTSAYKRQILESRMQSTEAIVQAISQVSRRPAVLVNASAVGYYGPRDPAVGPRPWPWAPLAVPARAAGRDVRPTRGVGAGATGLPVGLHEQSLTEAASPGQDFLAQTCQAWEEAARLAEPLGVRVVRLRIGLVLAEEGGALGRMLPAFRFGLGGPIGSGVQWVSWVQRADLIGLIRWALKESRVSGAINATAPNPVTMDEFAKTLGRVLHRPAVMRVPAFVLRTALGEMAEMLLSGQRVVPEAALKLGYSFAYPHLSEALAASVDGLGHSTP